MSVGLSSEIDEANRHGYVRAVELNGTHIGKGLWDFDDAEWREILSVLHTEDGHTTVTTIVRDSTYDPAQTRKHLSTEQSFDVTAHPMSDPRPTGKATE